ncbi:hypothetical protein [Kordiimonas aquimaris]|nr:hypothetical protein [Kordiimonas aquimaris]
MEWEALKLLSTGSDMLTYLVLYVLWKMDRRLVVVESERKPS